MSNDLTESRRADDFLMHADGKQRDFVSGDQLPKAALGWLKELVQGEFATAPVFGTEPDGASTSSSAGTPEEIDVNVWQREWKRRWRRFQLPGQLSAFSDAIGRARTAEEVYAVLSEHVVRVVGAFTCLVFLPQPGSALLRPLRNEKLAGNLDHLHIRRAPSYAGLIDAATATRDAEGQFGGLAPLFGEGGAVCLACVPFSGGALVLMERRAERQFEAEDWHLLRAISIQAEAVLERTRLFDRVRGLSQLDTTAGLTSNGTAKTVLDHAWQSARRGDPLTVVHIAVQGAGLADDQRLCTLAEILRQEGRGSGVTIRHGTAEFLLVLPQIDAVAAEAIIARVHQRLSQNVEISTGLAEYDSTMDTADHLVEAAGRNLRGPRLQPELCLEM